MGKFDVKSLINMGTGVGKLFLPGSAGQILDIVNKNIQDSGDPANAEGLKALAKDNEDQTVVLQNHEARIRALEAKLGIK